MAQLVAPLIIDPKFQGFNPAVAFSREKVFKEREKGNVFVSLNLIHIASLIEQRTNLPNKLECLSLATLSSLVFSNVLAYWAHW